jgi:hypothetical protein
MHHHVLQATDEFSIFRNSAWPGDLFESTFKVLVTLINTKLPRGFA